MRTPDDIEKTIDVLGISQYKCWAVQRRLHRTEVRIQSRCKQINTTGIDLPRRTSKLRPNSGFSKIGEVFNDKWSKIR